MFFEWKESDPGLKPRDSGMNKKQEKGKYMGNIKIDIINSNDNVLRDLKYIERIEIHDLQITCSIIEIILQSFHCSRKSKINLYKTLINKDL